MTRFGIWFRSVAGILQTAVVVLGWWLCEHLNLIHDPQHIQLCVWLTVYSAITQPILGYVNNLDSVSNTHLMEQLLRMEQQQLDWERLQEPRRGPENG